MDSTCQAPPAATEGPVPSARHGGDEGGALDPAARAPGQAERFAQATLDAIAEQVCVLDEQGIILSFNAAWRAAAVANGGDPASVLAGASYLQACRRACGPGSEQAAAFAAGLQRVLEGSLETFALEYPCHSPTEHRWFVVRLTRFTDGALPRVVVAHQDVSPLKRAEEALRITTERFEAALHASPVVVFNQDRELRYTWIYNPALGKQAQEVRGVTDAELFERPADAAAIAEFKRTVLATGVGGRQQFEVLDRGVLRTYDLTVEPQRDLAGQLHGVRCVAVDVTAQRETERRLAAALDWSERLMAAAPVGIAAYRVDTGRCVLANRAFQAAIGASEAQVLAQEFRSIPSWQRFGLLPAAEAALAAGVDQHLTTRLVSSFGREAWIHCVFSSFEGEGGRHLLLLLSDITELKRAEEALRASEARYRSLADSVTDAVFAFDDQLRYTFWNRECERNTGIAARDALGRGLLELFPGSAGGEAEQVYREVLRTGQPRSFSTSFPIGGVAQSWDVDCYPSADGLTVYSRNVTSKRELQERLGQMQRLASLGTLAAGMAHEINNPLTAVVTNLGFAAEQVRTLVASGGAAEAGVAGLADAAGALQDATDGALRIKGIVSALKRIAPGAPSEAAHCELGRAVDLAREASAGALAACAAVQVEVPTLPPVAMPEADLVQVLTNLLVNAGQATGPAPNLVRISAGTLAPDQLMVRIEDGGLGMGPEVLARAFEPFFSTRGVGGGQGLGLPVARGLVTAAGGDITLASEQGRGTVVTLRLPLARPQPA